MLKRFCAIGECDHAGVSAGQRERTIFFYEKISHADSRWRAFANSILATRLARS